MWGGSSSAPAAEQATAAATSEELRLLCSDAADALTPAAGRKPTARSKRRLATALACARRRPELLAHFDKNRGRLGEDSSRAVTPECEAVLELIVTSLLYDALRCAWCLRRVGAATAKGVSARGKPKPVPQVALQVHVASAEFSQSEELAIALASLFVEAGRRMEGAGSPARTHVLRLISAAAKDVRLPAAPRAHEHARIPSDAACPCPCAPSRVSVRGRPC